MKRIIRLTTALLLCCLTTTAQIDDDAKTWSTNDATMIGIGGYNVKDTYLSPLKYTGWGLRVSNERMKVVALCNYNVSRQQFINVDLSSTRNPAETATNFTGFVDYSLGYHYRFSPVENLKLLAGVSARAQLGFIYNTRNGNNPASAKADIDLNLSAMAIYTFKIKNYPLTIRYQIETPFAGVLFSPHYGQSYYEIFTLGNYDGVVQFSSFHNRLALRNYLTLDIPVSRFTIRTGLLNSSFRTNVHGLNSHVISNTFMIGIVKEFVSLGGKRLNKKSKYNSAYY